MARSNRNRSSESSQLGFGFSEPRDGRILTNESPDLRVGPAIDRILTTPAASSRYKEASSRIVCTGFSSLAYLSDKSEVLASASQFGPVDIVIGWYDLGEDAFVHSRRVITNVKEAFREYWLERGVAARQYPGILRLLSLVDSQAVRFLILPKMHAKLVVGPEEAVIGSSNFSYGGMNFQLEANLPHKRGIDQGYEDIRQVALRFCRNAKDATETIMELLHRLVRLVDWQEVVAKAASTVLDTEWFSEFEEIALTSADAKLWPSQRQTVAQALYLLQHHDCALIADATGSGKTRSLSALHVAQLLRSWHTGIPHRQRAAVFTPRSVEQSWHDEFRRYSVQVMPELVSHGLLSNAKKKESIEGVDRAISQSDIVYIDEAHNLYNDSQRSRRIHSARATRRVLATATPVGRNLDDVYPLIELLDPNNLPDDVIECLNSLSRTKLRATLDAEKREILSHAISQVTVRHTISQLNAMIDSAPEEYTDDMGNPCRYPEIQHQVYQMNETENDRSIAAQIEQIASQLVGIAGLPRDESVLMNDAYWKLNLPDSSHESAVQGTVNALAGLARYHVRECLRSSVPRLVEMIQGQVQAIEEFSLDLPASTTNGESSVLSALERWQQKGVPRVNRRAQRWLPYWFTDGQSFQETVGLERERYEQILELSRNLSSRRIESRLHEMQRLLHDYGKVLVFDDRIITLSYLHRVADEDALPVERLFDKDKVTKRAEEVFGQTAHDGEAIGLCSPRYSEGINLQGAQALMFSHIPQLYRHAEQRIGRIARMNSKFSEIHISWPQDAPEFRLSTDRQLYETAQDVQDVLGANVAPPPELSRRDTQVKVDANAAINAFDQNRREYEYNDGIYDAFDPIRSLVIGENALVDPAIYESVRGSQASLTAALYTTNVGVLHAPNAFVFASVVRDNRVPEFFFWSQHTGEVVSRNLSRLSELLRNAILEGHNPTDRAQAFENAGSIIEEAFDMFQKKRRSFLPNRHRRALDTFQQMVRWLYRNRKSIRAETDVIQRLQVLADIAEKGRHEQHAVDLRSLAEALIENVFEPLRRDLLGRKKKRPQRIITYEDVLKDLKNRMKSKDYVFPTPDVLDAIDHALRLEPPIEQQTVALLVGVDKSPISTEE